MTYSFERVRRTTPSPDASPSHLSDRRVGGPASPLQLRPRATPEVPEAASSAGRSDLPTYSFDRLPIHGGAHGAGSASPQDRTFKTWGSSGGRSGAVLDVTFSVTKTPASSLQVVQTFMGTRRTDGLKVGKYSWKRKGKTWDAFVDGGKNSPWVTLGGNAPAHPTKPYYLTPGEVASQVSFSNESGTVRVYDAPGAIVAHDQAHFETAIVAVNHKGKGKDKVLKAFRWGWTGKGTKPTVKKGTKIAGTASGIQVRGSVTPMFKNIVAHDYPKHNLKW